MKKFIIFIFTITMIVAILPACGSLSSPERTADKYFSAVKTGDLDKAIIPMPTKIMISRFPVQLRLTVIMRLCL